MHSLRACSLYSAALASTRITSGDVQHAGTNIPLGYRIQAASGTSTRAHYCPPPCSLTVSNLRRELLQEWQGPISAPPSSKFSFTDKM